MANPELRADQVSIVWLPRHNPRMALLTSAVPSLFDGPPLDAVRPDISHTAPEGGYATLVPAVIDSEWNVRIDGSVT